jgi:hypothetical protein
MCSTSGMPSIIPRTVGAMANRLAGETSPYLVQHKDNPVDCETSGFTLFSCSTRAVLDR